MRLFVALLLSGEMTDALEEAIRQIRPHTVSGRFSRRENLHLTLAFIGETNRVQAAKGALKEIEAIPFEMELQGLGRFRRDNGDILWAGIKKNCRLASLATQVQSALRSAGFVIEDRPFAAHLTLGREVVLEEGFDLKEFGREMKSVSMKVEKVSLMKSERINGKLTYTPVAFVELNKNKQ